MRVLSFFKSSLLTLRLAANVGRGRHEAVIARAHDLLALDPEDTVALAYLVRSHKALGRNRESRAWRRRLTEAKSKAKGR